MKVILLVGHISPRDKRGPGGIFSDETGLYMIYPDAGQIKIDEIIWHLKTHHTIEIVNYALEDGNTKTMIRHYGDPVKEEVLKNAKFVQPYPVKGDVLEMCAGDRVSIVDAGVIPDETLDTIKQAAASKLVKVVYTKENEEQ